MKLSALLVSMTKREVSDLDVVEEHYIFKLGSFAVLSRRAVLKDVCFAAAITSVVQCDKISVPAAMCPLLTPVSSMKQSARQLAGLRRTCRGPGSVDNCTL